MTTALGSPTRRIDAAAKVAGTAPYPADLVPPGSLYACVAFTGQPHARLVDLDVSAAEAAPGVVMVLTAEDVPVNSYGLMVPDQPVLIGPPGTPEGVSRWEADHLAVVIAESPETARAAATRIRARWEPLPVVPDIDAAAAGDQLVWPDRPDNVAYAYRIRKGDADDAWDDAEVVVEATYEVPWQEHAYLQPEAGLAHIDEQGRITVTVGGQWTHEDRAQIAHSLALPDDRIRVVYPAIGGAFGGREDMSLQIVLALAAWRLQQRGLTRPVAASWSREESILGHHKRHRGRIHTRWGARRDGRLVVVEADAFLDAGAYTYTSNKVLANLHLTVAGPYAIPHARIDSKALWTNSVPGGAFRGFGAPQGAFAAEGQMNRLAAALGMDPVELRRINLLDEGVDGITQVPLPPGVTIRKVVDACADAARWDRPPASRPPIRPIASLPGEPSAVRRGRGFACGLKNVGFSFGFDERCEAMIVLKGDPDDEVPTAAELHHAGADVGQGAHTVFLMMASEATGVPMTAITGHFSDSATSGDSGSASASRLTFMAGNAIRGAAEEAEKRWREGDRPAVGMFRFSPRATTGLDPLTGAGDPNITYGYVAQAVEVAVDVETGHVVVERVVSAGDVGKAINPKLLDGQVHGAVVQAHGYAITEDLRDDRQGHLLNPRLSGYLIPGIGDVPQRIDSVVLELADPQGPWGARGMAEMPMIPYAPAVTAALFDATGVWVDTLPLTPDRVRAALVAAGVVPDA